MRIILLSFLRRLSVIGLRQIATSLLANGHVPIIVFADGSQIAQKRLVSALAQSIAQLNPDLIGINVYTNHAPLATEITSILRDSNNCPIIWGGPHPSAVSELCLQSADYVCIGEGEISLVQMVNSLSDNYSLKSEIHGIRSRYTPAYQRQHFSISANLDDLPIPQWLGYEQYVWRNHGLKLLDHREIPGLLDYKYDIVTSRGCPFSCSYCYNSQIRQVIKSNDNCSSYMRRRSIDHVIRELEIAIQKFPQINFVNFWDDCFTMDINYLESFSAEYMNRIGLPFYCLSRFEFLTDTAIEVLQRAGLVSIQIGVQTAGLNALRLFKRCLPPQNDIDRVARTLQKFGIHCIYDVIVNNPFESIDEVEKTVRFFLQLPAPFQVNGWDLCFLPGTELEAKALSEGYIEPARTNKLSQLLFSNINSPILFPFHDQLPSGPYVCLYNQENKRYLNAILAMLSSWPKKFIKLLYYGRNVVPLQLLQWLWKRDILVCNPTHRCDTRRAQAEGLLDLAAAGQKELAARLVFELKHEKNVTDDVKKICNNLV